MDFLGLSIQLTCMTLSKKKMRGFTDRSRNTFLKNGKIAVLCQVWRTQPNPGRLRVVPDRHSRHSRRASSGSKENCPVDVLTSRGMFAKDACSKDDCDEGMCVTFKIILVFLVIICT
ncbi:hypothetical protein AVEN_134841-1 [Araneus ventricosus]|uniref:Uncharacterized protein n=1 Tax=Araneus ventricosus TaxID=182803 RepID=A0A4Y2WMS0_ARAVE|nr:hypothetical protein AVEN_134841-1 [Araneus ventricosus]